MPSSVNISSRQNALRSEIQFRFVCKWIQMQFYVTFWLIQFLAKRDDDKSW
jgi:hypothetical protein